MKKFIKLVTKIISYIFFYSRLCKQSTYAEKQGMGKTEGDGALLESMEN